MVGERIPTDVGSRFDLFTYHLNFGNYCLNIRVVKYIRFFERSNTVNIGLKIYAICARYATINVIVRITIITVITMVVTTVVVNKM